MGQRNNGQDEANILQNQFTAYLLTAIWRRKCIYNKKRAYLRAHEVSVNCQTHEPVDEKASDAMLSALPLMMQLENTLLMQAIKDLTPKERYILFERVLSERSYHELGRPLGLQYSGVAAAYCRIIRKLWKRLGGGRE